MQMLVMVPDAPPPLQTPTSGGMGDAAAGAAAPPAAVAAAGPEALTLLAESKMRCGGCGGKVGYKATVSPEVICEPWSWGYSPGAHGIRGQYAWWGKGVLCHAMIGCTHVTVMSAVLPCACLPDHVRTCRWARACCLARWRGYPSRRLGRGCWWRWTPLMTRPS